MQSKNYKKGQDYGRWVKLDNDGLSCGKFPKMTEKSDTQISVPRPVIQLWKTFTDNCINSIFCPKYYQTCNEAPHLARMVTDMSSSGRSTGTPTTPIVGEPLFSELKWDSQTWLVMAGAVAGTLALHLSCCSHYNETQPPDVHATTGREDLKTHGVCHNSMNTEWQSTTQTLCQTFQWYYEVFLIRGKG